MSGGMGFCSKTEPKKLAATVARRPVDWTCGRQQAHAGPLRVYGWAGTAQIWPNLAQNGSLLAKNWPVFFLPYIRKIMRLRKQLLRVLSFSPHLNCIPILFYPFFRFFSFLFLPFFSYLPFLSYLSFPTLPFVSSYPPE